MVAVPLHWQLGEQLSRYLSGYVGKQRTESDYCSYPIHPFQHLSSHPIPSICLALLSIQDHSPLAPKTDTLPPPLVLE